MSAATIGIRLGTGTVQRYFCLCAHFLFCLILYRKTGKSWASKHIWCLAHFHRAQHFIGVPTFSSGFQLYCLHKKFDPARSAVGNFVYVLIEPSSFLWVVCSPEARLCSQSLIFNVTRSFHKNLLRCTCFKWQSCYLMISDGYTNSTYLWGKVTSWSFYLCVYINILT
jgi:hypothetical protein